MSNIFETDEDGAAAERLSAIQARMAAARREAAQLRGAEKSAVSPARLIAVSKTFDAEHITPLIEAGQRLFGENRVQEAKEKWPALLENWPEIELHLIGPLQSNKAKEAVALFDVIHTVDRPKIAAALAKEMAAQQKFPKLLVQVNSGEEAQKAGIAPQDLMAFLKTCHDEHGLKIKGLMCIPPQDEEPALHFALLAKLAQEARQTYPDITELSMGMSADFETAVQFGATYIRVGRALFGARG